MHDAPHDHPPIEIETSATPEAAVIWLHGLGADGNDFAPVVPELDLPTDFGIRFIFPHAPYRPVTCNGGYVMRAWYDIYSLDDFQQEDQQGLAESLAQVEALIDREAERGISSERIVLMGFSQGGAVSLYTGLRTNKPLAGIGALSTYLPLQGQTDADTISNNTSTPIFMAHGLYDPVVRFQYGETSFQKLRTLGLKTSWHAYPMEHNVCLEELTDISHWLAQCLRK